MVALERQRVALSTRRRTCAVRPGTGVTPRWLLHEPTHAPTHRPQSLEVTFTTPLRAKHRGRWVQPSALTPSVLSALLLRRLGGLAACYTDAMTTDATVDAYRESGYALADATTLTPVSLQWTDTFRYSARQRKAVPAGGLTGSVRLEAPAQWLDHWSELLEQASHVHLGKGTAFGLGGVSVRLQQ